jgi:hypothetical protein
MLAKAKKKLTKFKKLLWQFLLREWLKLPHFGKLKVRFFIQSPEVWPSLETVWQAFQQDKSINVLIISLPFLHDSTSIKSPSSFLDGKHIPYKVGDEYNIFLDRPDLVFFQNPYDSTRPEKYSSRILSNYNFKFAYVPYGLEVGGGDENIQWQYNQDVQKKAWRIFARSERHKKMFQQYCDSKGNNVVVTGHPKLDLLNEQVDTKIYLKFKRKIEGRKVVLWSCHFTVGNPPILWSTYQMYSEHIFSYFSQNQHLALILRPHPLFFPRMRNEGIFSEQQELEFRANIDNYPNVILDENSDYHASFNLSDALMTDAGSFLMEYLPTKKPILYLENSNGPGLNEEGSIVETYYTGRNLADINQFFEMITNDQDPLQVKRLSQINEFLYKVDGKSGRRIKEHIVANLCK